MALTYAEKEECWKCIDTIISLIQDARATSLLNEMWDSQGGLDAWLELYTSPYEHILKGPAKKYCESWYQFLQADKQFRYLVG